jgi:hypothetical protein
LALNIGSHFTRNPFVPVVQVTDTSPGHNGVSSSAVVTSEQLGQSVAAA